MSEVNLIGITKPSAYTNCLTAEDLVQCIFPTESIRKDGMPLVKVRTSSSIRL